MEFKLPAILDQFSDAELIAAVPKIELRRIYWDDLNLEDTVVLEVLVTEKLGLLYALLTGSYNPIYYRKSNEQGPIIVPGGLLMAFISAVGGCYLGGKNIFLVQKRKSFFLRPVNYNTRLLIRGTVLRKFTKTITKKNRYYADLCQTVNIEMGGELVRMVETGARAGVLQKTRPENERKDEIIPNISFSLPDLLINLDDKTLREHISEDYSSKPFTEIKVKGGVEVTIRVTHKMILLFALISGDYNPLHTSPEFAATLSAFEGKNIAHGALLSAWLSGIGVLELLGPGYHLIKKEKAVYNKAVKVGDEILISLEIIQKTIRKRGKNRNKRVKIAEKIFIKGNKSEFREAVKSAATYESYI